MFRLFRRRPDPSARMVAEADALRDAGQYSEAARAYARVLPLLPERIDLIVQYANMLKDSGDPEAAETAYRAAIAQAPWIADTPCQLGHLLKSRGDRDGAHRAYRQALALDPGFTAAARELRHAGDAAFLATTLQPDAAAASLRALPGEATWLERADAVVPVALWPALRAAWDVPAPPPNEGTPAISITVIGGEDLIEPAATHALLCLNGERLHPHALAWFAYAAAIAPDAAFIADAETQDAAGCPAHPILRSLPDPVALAAAGPSPGIVLAPVALARAVRDAPDPAAALKALVRDAASSGRIGHIPLPLAVETAPPAVAPAPPTPAPAPNTLIHVIIPTRNNGGDVGAFIASLRATATAPENLTFTVIDNGSDDPATAEALARLSRIRVLRRDTPFNWSRLSNEGAALSSDADIHLFANDDMLMVSAGWDEALRRRLSDPSIGGVGARLVYPGGRVQHAGILAGWQGRFIHDGLDAAPDEQGPEGRWRSAHAVSAVTGAFLAVRREDFDRLGGFDDVAFSVSYGDVDFCYRLREAGLRVVYEPAIEAVHHESKTRGRDEDDPVKQARDDAEFAAFAARWGTPLADPSVNPFWADVGRPFRFVIPPARAAIEAHIALTASGAPWMPRRAGG